MEVPQARLITVKSAVLSTEELEEEERIIQQVESKQAKKLRRPSITVGRVVTVINSPDTLDFNQQEDSGTESIQRAPGNKASIFIVEGETTAQSHRVKLRELTKTDCLALHSTSTTLAEDDCEGQGSSIFGGIAGSDSVTQILDWFKSLLTQVSKNGIVTLKDMKQTARDYEVIHIIR